MTQFEDFRRRANYVITICLSSILLLLFLWTARYILLLLFAGCIGALVISFFTAKLESWTRMPRFISYGLVVLCLATVLGLGITMRGPSFVHEISTLKSELPAAVQQIEGKLQSVGWGRWLVAQATDPDQISEKVGYILARVGGAMYFTLATLAGIFLVMMTSLYIAAEPEFYARGMRRVVPTRVRTEFQASVGTAVKALQTWLIAKLVSMTAIGTIIVIGLLVLGVPLAGTLGTIAGLLTFVPNIGPIVSVLPALLLAFAISPWKGLLTMLLFVFAHFLEGNLVTPLAERKLVKLPPALTLAVQLLLAPATGALGVALAAPLTAVAIAILGNRLPPERDSPQGPATACPNLPLSVQGS